MKIMDLENAKVWASQPDVCRCCLSASGTKDLTASYVKEDVKEVLADMLHQCFGITLSRLTEWGPSRLVCALCVGHLRDACSFRRQVEAAERCFDEYCHQKFHAADFAIKSESPDVEMDCLDNDVPTLLNNFDNDGPTLLHNLEQYPNKSLPKHDKQKTIRRRKKISRTKVRKKQILERDTENDSDTPIAELTKREAGKLIENEPSAIGDKTEFDTDVIQRNNCEITVDNALKSCSNKTNNSIATNKTKPSIKQISERKRVMLTCQTVLKYTTACPFRHYKSWFQCFYCLEEYMEIQLLRKHTFQAHCDVENELKKLKRYPRSLQIDISELKCVQCSLTLVNVANMKTHLEEKHREVIYNECIADYKVDKSPYVCHICKIEFHVFRTLTMHLNDHYANCICDVCGKSFINSKRLKVHKRTHENGSFPCNECGKVLKTKTSKANHMETHSKRVLKCQICLKPIKHYNHRIKHMSEAHGITHKFKCPICPREYNIKHYLATHVRQTHGSKNKKCSECSMAFITNHGLKKHMLKHTGEKPYVCDVCCKAYARSYTLKEHMRAHDNDRKLTFAE